MDILGTIKVHQASEDVKLDVIDKQAEMMIIAEAIRYSYMEENGAHVTLDILDDTVSLRRRDTGLTQGIFDLQKTTQMKVHSEHGIVIFDLKVDTLRFDGEELFIEYSLFHNNEAVGHHLFKLNWEPEV